jgi:long-subunit fatty acid transport protein
MGRCLVGLLLLALPLRAQFVEDALRLARLDGFVTPRAGALGIGFTALSDDIGSLYYNPAGLILIRGTELTGGLFFARNSTETSFLRATTPAASNSTALTHLGIATTDQWRSTRAALAVAYALENDYENSLRYSGFNPSSSIVAYWTESEPTPRQNWAFRLYLADTVNGRMVTPVRDSLQQEGFVRERGGLHSLTGGIAFELSRWVSLGFTVALKYGRFSYSRDYRETDVLNRYNQLDTLWFTNVDFAALQLQEDLTQELSGITGSVGLLVRMGDFLRLGTQVRFPTFFQVRERFSRSAQARFDNGDSRSLRETGQNSYNVRTPFVFAGGVAFHLPGPGLTFSAGAAYSDVTQLEFTDAPWELLQLNRLILEQLVGQTLWGAGLEWDLPLLPLTVRASFNSITSPYGRDIPGATTQVYSAGASLYLAPNIRLDFLLRRLELSELRTNYGDQTYSFTRTPLTIAASLTYRYGP